jgi:hypothetical protein
MNMMWNAVTYEKETYLFAVTSNEDSTEFTHYMIAKYDSYEHFSPTFNMLISPDLRCAEKMQEDFVKLFNQYPLQMIHFFNEYQEIKNSSCSDKEKNKKFENFFEKRFHVFLLENSEGSKK